MFVDQHGADGFIPKRKKCWWNKWVEYSFPLTIRVKYYFLWKSLEKFVSLECFWLLSVFMLVIILVTFFNNPVFIVYIISCEDNTFVDRHLVFLFFFLYKITKGFKVLQMFHLEKSILYKYTNKRSLLDQIKCSGTKHTAMRYFNPGVRSTHDQYIWNFD